MVWSLPESQMRKNNKNILVVPEFSSKKSSQGACAENVESLRPQTAPHTCLESVESANWISTWICSQILFLANT